jgi:hypothetical protein
MPDKRHSATLMWHQPHVDRTATKCYLACKLYRMLLHVTDNHYTLSLTIPSWSYMQNVVKFLYVPTKLMVPIYVPKITL